MMLSLTDYQENANQSQNYISSHTPQNGYHGYQDQIKEVLVRMLWGKKEHLHTVGGKVIWSNHY